MFTYCFINEFICNFILLCILYFYGDECCKINFNKVLLYCIVLYLLYVLVEPVLGDWVPLKEPGHPLLHRQLPFLRCLALRLLHDELLMCRHLLVTFLYRLRHMQPESVDGQQTQLIPHDTSKVTVEDTWHTIITKQLSICS